VSTTNPLCDHGKSIPVTLPSNTALQFGEFWSGSPYLGKKGVLPPGAGISNAAGGYYFMWHSHTEKEIVNNNIFPGGMMTMGVVEAPGVPID
jgi:manganese oxidase